MVAGQPDATRSTTPPVPRSCKVASGTAGRHVGQEADVQMTYALNATTVDRRRLRQHLSRNISEERNTRQAISLSLCDVHLLILKLEVQGSMKQSRRRFLKTTATTAAAGILAGVPKGLGGRRLCRRFSGNAQRSFRNHRADRLFVDRDGARTGILQEVRNQFHRFEGSVVGRHSRQAHAR